MRLIIFDTETTGKDEKDRICQFAYSEWGVGEKIELIGEVNHLFNPPVPITFGAMATHHITQKMVDDQPAFIGSEPYETIKEVMEDEQTYCVAHNAKFDVAMLAKEGIFPKNVIDTLRIARHFDKEGNVESYKLQFLRYLLGLEVEATAHDALGDVRVLKALFDRLYTKVTEEYKIPFPMPEDYLKEMVRISSHHVMVVRFQFGKYIGKKVAYVAKKDPQYLKWLLGSESSKPDADADLVFTIQKLLRI